MIRAILRRRMRHVSAFVMTLLAIELLDEFVFGVREAAWPLIRTELGLTYAQIGVLLSVPNLVSAVIEPLLGVLGDVWKRWILIIAGGLIYAAAVFVTAAADSFALLLVTMILAYPASGAFVGLAQATLMDQDPDRHEQLMARWVGPMLQAARFHCELLEKRIAALEQRPAGVTWAGTFEAGKDYGVGQLVTRSGSLWLATRATHDTPGDASGAWRLVVKSGSYR